jgi:hypothetical protein
MTDSGRHLVEQRPLAAEQDQIDGDSPAQKFPGQSNRHPLDTANVH